VDILEEVDPQASRAFSLAPYAPSHGYSAFEPILVEGNPSASSAGVQGINADFDGESDWQSTAAIDRGSVEAHTCEARQHLQPGHRRAIITRRQYWLWVTTT